MADIEKGIVVKIGADTTELNKSLREIDKETRNTTKSLKNVEDGLKLNPKNTELIKEKMFLLTKQTDNAQKRLKVLNKLQEEMKKKGVDTNSDQYRKVSVEIQKTQDQLAKSKSVIKQTKDESNKLKNALGGLGKGFLTVSAIAVASITATAVALGKLLSDVSDLSDDLTTLASKSELTTDQLQEVAYASDLLGISANEYTNYLTKINKELEGALQGNVKYADSFQYLGVAITDVNGNARSSSEVFYDVIDALAQVEDIVKKDQIANELFGTSYQELNPLLQAGGDNLRALSEEAHNVGYVMSEDALKGLNDYENALDRIKNSCEALKNSLAVAVLPAFQKVADDVLEQVQEFSSMVADGASIDKIVDKIFEKMPDAIDKIIGYLEVAVNQILDYAPTLLDKFVDLIPIVFEKVLNIDWGTLVKKVINILIDLITQDVPELVTKLGDVLFTKLQELFSKDGLTKLKDFGLEIGTNLLSGILGVLEKGLNSVIAVINKVVGVFGWEGLEEVNFASNISNALTNSTPQLASNSEFTQTANAVSSDYSKANISVEFTGSLSQLANILQPEISVAMDNAGSSLVR